MQTRNAIALGTFDGVHKGHRAVLNLPDGYKKTAVTFDLPPKMFFAGKKSLITSVQDKCSILKNCGMNEVYTLEFEKVKDMLPQGFLKFLKSEFNPFYISCGFNYRFGKGGEGTAEMLGAFCEKNGIEFNCVPPVSDTGEIVSSTVIRDMLKSGETEKANKLLSQPFSFESEVINGFKRARTIGFPTVNQKYPEELIKIKFGVYASSVIFGGKRYSGITNIGMRPTFKTDYVISETFIKGFSGDLYGKALRIVPEFFIREEKKFSSLEEIKDQIKKDLIYQENKNGN